MIKFAEQLHEKLVTDLRKYGYFEVIKIFEESGYLNIHIITEEGYNLTATYYLSEDTLDYDLIGIYNGFLKETQTKHDRLTVRELTWLKRDFDNDALKCLELMKGLDDFSHLEYMLEECGGYCTVKMLSENSVPEELIKLAGCARLDLSLENLALQKKYQPLFTHRELMRSYNRLMYFANVTAATKANATQLYIKKHTARHKKHLRLVKAS